MLPANYLVKGPTIFSYTFIKVLGQFSIHVVLKDNKQIKGSKRRYVSCSVLRFNSVLMCVRTKVPSRQSTTDKKVSAVKLQNISYYSENL